LGPSPLGGGEESNQTEKGKKREPIKCLKKEGGQEKVFVQRKEGGGERRSNLHRVGRAEGRFISTKKENRSARGGKKEGKKGKLSGFNILGRKGEGGEVISSSRKRGDHNFRPPFRERKGEKETAPGVRRFWEGKRKEEKKMTSC